MEAVMMNVAHRLREAKLRPTRQRVALARLLFAQGDRHITAEQLRTEAAAANVAVSLATVYNTLNQFKAAGILREVMIEPGQSYFDTNVNDHHHFFLEDAAVLVDIPGEHIAVTTLPEPPPGTAISRVDVIIRIQESRPFHR